jgi:hypothetical protein
MSCATCENVGRAPITIIERGAQMFMSRVIRIALPMRVLAVLLVVSVLPGCDDDSDTSSCTPIAAGEFGCQDAADCLALKVSWNHPETSQRAGGGFDLTLWIDENTFIDSGSVGAVCRHTGDVEAVGFEEQSETIICDTPLAGSYRFVWTSFLVVGRDAKIEVNDLGSVSCSLQEAINTGERIITIP